MQCTPCVPAAGVPVSDPHHHWCPAGHGHRAVLWHVGPHQCTCCYSVLFTSEHLLKEGTSAVHCSLVSLFSRTGCLFHYINVFFLVGFAVRQAQRGGCYFVCVCVPCSSSYLLKLFHWVYPEPFLYSSTWIFFSDGSSIVLKFNSSLKAFNVSCYIKVTVNTGYSLKPQKQNYSVWFGSI